MARVQVLVTRVCCALAVALSLVGEARAETAKEDQVVFLGLRPLTRAGGKSDVRKVAEAQRIRVVAESVLATVAQRPITGHSDLVAVLGKTYVDRWIRCSKHLKCVDPFLASLQTAGHRIGVVGDYYLVRGVYHFRLVTFSIADTTPVKLVEFTIAARDISNRKKWQAGMSPLLENPLGLVKLSSNVTDPACLVDGDPCVMDKDGKSLRLAAGEHKISLAKDGYDTKAINVTVSAGEEQEIELSLEAPRAIPPPEPSPAGASAPPPAEKPVPPALQPPPAHTGGWTLKAAEIDQSIKVDGVLSDEAWSRATPIGESFEDTPTYGVAPPVATVARVLYDRDALYLGFEMETWKPDEPKATVRTRDDLGMLSTDDVIVIALGLPEGAGTTVILGVNSLGTQFDTSGDRNGDIQPNDYNFTSATATTPGHWSVEIRIPWRELPLAKVTGERDLRMIYARFHPARGGVYRWPLMPKGVNDRLPEYYGHLTGITNVTSGGALTVLPYISAHALYSAGEPYFVQRAGGDARLRLGWFSAELTVLPDLTDVRPDDQTINLTRFELFQPEQRPFFQTGVDVFQFGTTGLAQMFYSRRIGLDADGNEIPILGGLKGYGRAGNVGAGVLAVLTAPTSTVIDPLQLSPTVLNAVAAVLWRPTPAVQVGLMGTEYLGETLPPEMPPPGPLPPSQGTSFGADLQITKGLWQLVAFSSGSYNDADDNPPVGSSQNLAIKYVGAHVRPSASILVNNNTYNPLLGFVLRKDIAQTAASVGLVSQLDTWVKEVQVIPNATTNFDHRFEARIGYTAGVDVVASSALWSVTAFAHATEDSSAVDFDVLGETIPAGFYTGGDYAVSLSHLYNNPIVTVSYERNNAFFTGHADTVNGLVTSAIGSRLSVSANASGTRAKFRDQTIDVAVVNASVAVTPVDHLYLQGLVGYNSFTETALGIGSVIWQWSSRSRAALQVDHQPRLDMTSETQAFVKVVKDFSL